jgi:hypothetical protein
MIIDMTGESAREARHRTIEATPLCHDTAANFIKDGATAIFREKPTRIALRKFAGIQGLERDIRFVWERGTAQRGLANLSRAHHYNHWVDTGEFREFSRDHRPRCPSSHESAIVFTIHVATPM